ncbi:uncharacterized protein LOC113353292 [Papaver somniferum]|uniref:uncharacterized protein LOC113353292 n=1 Tax=Papaver somniferum TaxID=3469 RepID=UPI000E702CDF|nr:uncharacterized protein LOC113353292 [Papaver somniferum]
MGVMFGMPRMAGRKLMTLFDGSGGWSRNHSTLDTLVIATRLQRPMLQDAILKLLKRTGIKNCKSEGGEDSDDDNDEQVTDNAHKLKEKYFGLVDDLEKSKNVSWPDLIHSFLEKKINQNYNTPEDITGCVVYLLLLYAEHTHLVKPVTLPDDRYLPRAARWNIKEISVEFLKDMEASQYTFSKEFKDEYTMYEKEMLNEIAQRLPVEEVPLTVDWQEKFEDLEVKNEDLRLTIAEKWCELQSRKDGLPIDVSILEELLNDIYHRAYPPPQPNSGEEESSSSSEEGHDDLDDTVPSATTPLVTEDEQEIPDDTQEKSNEQGNATPTMPVMGGSEENLTQFDIEVSQFKIWARSDLERKVKELQEEKSMPEPSQTEKAELQQTAATQVLGNIEVEIGSLRDRQGASLEEMLPNMQFMPLVCELPSLKELHTVPMEKLIDLAIHGKGIYTDENS